MNEIRKTENDTDKWINKLVKERVNKWFYYEKNYQWLCVSASDTTYIKIKETGNYSHNFDITMLPKIIWKLWYANYL